MTDRSWYFEQSRKEYDILLKKNKRKKRSVPLTFDTLRRANLARLPKFLNKYGKPAHTKPDGSDWSVAQWLQAVVGEVGEFANLRKKFERGDLTNDEFQKEAAKELADIQIYLDILAFQVGVDLGKATISKWDEVSKRIGLDMKIEDYNNKKKNGSERVSRQHQLDQEKHHSHKRKSRSS